MESTKYCGLYFQEVLVDAIYGSDENFEAAKTTGVNYSSIMSPPKDAVISLLGIEFSEKDKVISCPKMHTPVKTMTKKRRHTLTFSPDHCVNCSLISDCQVKQGKRYLYLLYHDKALRIAKRGPGKTA